MNWKIKISNQILINVQEYISKYLINLFMELIAVLLHLQIYFQKISTSKLIFIEDYVIGRFSILVEKE